MDYYDLLGVSRQASAKELKSAFKKKSMEHHPDRGGDEEKFKQINEAYQNLSDPQKRQMYDQFGTVDPQQQGGPQGFSFNFQGGPGGFDINDLMGQFGFGQFGQRQMRNEDITIGCRITLREVYTGKNVLATYRLRNGQEQTVDIKLPPGVSPGDKIRYAGMGQKDIPNAPPGDLYVQIQVQAEKDWEIIACSRNPEKSKDLLELSKKFPENIIIERLDVSNFEAVSDLSQKYSNKPIDILINNAGTLGPKGVPEAMGYQNIDHMDFEIWRDILEVNLLAPFKVATAFHDQVAMSERKILIMMSSDLGSVQQNNFGGLYSYRASKAGLNILSKGMSIDWDDITVIALAPGWCKTYLGGEEAEIEPDISVAEQQLMFESIKPDDSGKFLDRFGNEVPW